VIRLPQLLFFALVIFAFVILGQPFYPPRDSLTGVRRNVKEAGALTVDDPIEISSRPCWRSEGRAACAVGVHGLGDRRRPNMDAAVHGAG